MKEFISKSEELNRVIEKMYVIKSENDREGICDELDFIYLKEDGSLDENFRHEYSSISGKIRELNEVEIEGEKVFVLDYLLLNIESVYDYACKKKKPYIRNLFKLKDHIGLEAGRILLVEQLKWEINNGQESVKSQLEQMRDFAEAIGNQVHTSRAFMAELERQESENKQNINNSKNKIEELNKLSDDIKDKVEGVHRDSITILGIFSSVVLAFTGGLVFSSSVLENIGNASAYRIIIVTLIIGFVLVNAIIALILYIGKITHVKSKTEFDFKKFWGENAFWIVVNLILFILIVFTYCGWLSSSEKAVLDQSNQYQIEMHRYNTQKLKMESISGNILEE